MRCRQKRGPRSASGERFAKSQSRGKKAGGTVARLPPRHITQGRGRFRTAARAWSASMYVFKGLVRRFDVRFQAFCKVTTNFWNVQITWSQLGACRVNWQVQNYKIFLKNSTFGVEKSNFLRGRSLMAYWA